MDINEKIDNYLNEEDDAGEDDELYGQQVENELAQKVGLLAIIMDKKKEAPVMKRVVGKAMVGKPLGDTERQVLVAIMDRFFRPEKGKFKRLMSKF